MRRTFLWKQMRTIFIITACLFIKFSPTAYGAVQNFSGDFSEDSDRYVNWSVDIPFTIPEHSETDFEFDSLCENDVYFYLIIAANKAITYDKIISYHIVKERGPDQFVNNIPLSQGDYIARMYCTRDVLTSYPNPEWNLKVTSSPISIAGYAPDQEPPSGEPVNVYSTKSFTGWMGLWGTAGAISPNSYFSNALDASDRLLVNMKKGSKVKFKVEWGEFRTSTDDAIHWRVNVEKYLDGKTYFVASFPLIWNSGDITEEITLLEDQAYRVSIGAFSEHDPKRYGGYNLTVIIDGELPPEAEPEKIHLNFLSKKWKRLDGINAYVVKYSIRNTYKTPKILKFSLGMLVPMLDISEIEPINDDSNIVQYAAYAMSWQEVLSSKYPYWLGGIEVNVDSCETDDTDWPKRSIMFPGQCLQENDKCQLLESHYIEQEFFDVGPGETVQRSLTVLFDNADYKNFDEGFQMIHFEMEVLNELELHRCMVWGSYHWPVSAIISPFMLLLK